MYFKGTIVNPCYIIKENPIKCPNEEDFGLLASISSKPFKDYSTPEELAYKAALDYYFSESRKYDDWGKCDFGENMEVLGIHNYISESTIYGGCTTYQTEEEPKELLESILRVLNDNLEDEEYGELPIPDEAIGVFLLDDAYNPDWKSWIEEHSWCATIIEGEVEYYIDEEAHIVGSINFYTAQTGI